MPVSIRYLLATIVVLACAYFTSPLETLFGFLVLVGGPVTYLVAVKNSDIDTVDDFTTLE